MSDRMYSGEVADFNMQNQGFNSQRRVHLISLGSLYQKYQLSVKSFSGNKFLHPDVCRY